MIILTKSTTGKTSRKISVEDYVDQMKDNLLGGRDIFEQTPIGKKANGDFVWWEDECSTNKNKNPVLDKQSVRDMIKSVKGML